MPTKAGPNRKYIQDPELIWQYFQEYKKEVKGNPRLVHVFVGKEGKDAWQQKERPLIYEGFINFCQNNYHDVNHYFCNVDKRYSEYIEVCARVKREIKQDQIDGGMTGEYNHSITQRLNGLKEFTENTTTHNIPLMNIDPLLPPAEEQQALDEADDSAQENSGA